MIEKWNDFFHYPKNPNTKKTLFFYVEVNVKI